MAGPRNMDGPDDKPLESAVELRTFATGIWVTRDYQYRTNCWLKKKKAVCSASTSQSHSNFSMFEIRISRLQIQ